ALIGAVVWLYNNNETARKIIDGAWKGIKAAVKATVDWITNTAVPFLKKAWDVIKIGARKVANFFMTYLWPGIKFVIDLIVGYYKFLWNVAKAVFQGVIVAIRKFVNFFKSVWKVIKTVWQYIVGAFKAAFNVVSTIFRVIGKVARAFAILFMKYVWPHIRKVLNWIADKFKWWWGVIKTAWKIIKNVVIKPVVAWFQKYV